jgi:hypothetical protein
MSKKSSSNPTYDNSSNIKSTGSLYDTNIQNNNQQIFADSINRSLDQTKENISKSIAESQSQIPHYNTIINNYQEQSLQTAKEISENFIESQKSIINSIQSAWIPFKQNFNTTSNSRCISPEAVANVYSRFVSTVTDNTVSALRTTNNIIFSSLDSWKSTLQQAKDNSKHLFDLNSKAAKTFEQNAREVRAAVQDISSRFNASINNNINSGSNTNSPTNGISSTTTTSTTSSA